MAEIRYSITFEDDRIIATLTPTISDKEVVYYFDRKDDKERSVKFYTATTDMKDWIGKIRKITNNNKVSVEGIYRGKNQTLNNIILVGLKNPRIGERVMVTEHIDVSGQFNMLATKKRIQDLRKPELNFINIGWSTDKQCRYLRIDPYIGNTKECIGQPL